MQAGVVTVDAAGDRPTGTIEGGRLGQGGLTNGLAIGNDAVSGSHQSIAIGYRALS